jgi:cytochrome c peroxidase
MVFKDLARGAAASLGLLLLGACAGDMPSAPANDFVGGHPVLAVTGVATVDAQIAAGEAIFNDKNLSRLRNQSCASCHSANWGWGPPDDGSIVSLDAAFFAGSLNKARSPHFGKRKAPPAAYAAFAPVLRFDPIEGTFIGGNFWDGRATGLISGSPALDQALGPFLASNEHAFSAVCVLWEISRSRYAQLFDAGAPVKFASMPFNRIRNANNTPATIDSFCHNGAPADIPRLPRGWTEQDLTAVLPSYTHVGQVIAEFERSPKVSKFNAKFDAVLAGSEQFTPDEAAGKLLFEGRGTCESCHSSEGDVREQFTDFSYYNLGVPQHPRNGTAFIDRGLGVTVNNPAFNGFFKSSSLRNVAKVGFSATRGWGRKTYMHNGVLTSLEQVVHFYNTRDSKRCAPGVTGPLPTGPTDRRPNACWTAPEFPNTVIDFIGNIGLTELEERQIVAYMRTFTDRN